MSRIALIVSDNEEQLDLIGQILVELNFIIIRAQNIQKAWANSQQKDIELLITQLQFEKGSGIELIKKFSEKNKTPQYIFLFADKMSDYEKELSDFKNLNFMITPFTSEELKTEILKAKPEYQPEQNIDLNIFFPPLLKFMNDFIVEFTKDQPVFGEIEIKKEIQEMSSEVLFHYLFFIKGHKLRIGLCTTYEWAQMVCGTIFKLNTVRESNKEKTLETIDKINKFLGIKLKEALVQIDDQGDLLEAHTYFSQKGEVTLDLSQKYTLYHTEITTLLGYLQLSLYTV